MQSYYLPNIYADITIRSQKYREQGDDIRANAALELKQQLEEHYPNLRDL